MVVVLTATTWLMKRYGLSRFIKKVLKIKSLLQKPILF
jgi:hypothetical protein